MAQYRIKAQKTGVRTYEKELQMISYRGDALFSDEGNPLISKKDVYYPPDYLSKGSTAVVMDPKSYKKDGLSTTNIYSKGRPAALPIIEQFSEESAVSRSLLGINRAETQQGIFDDVSSYGLDERDWVVYSGWSGWEQRSSWDRKNSPAGPYIPTRDQDYSKGSSIIIDSYPVPYSDPGNVPVTDKIRGFSRTTPDLGWAQYLQSLVAMYVIEYMVNNFTQEQKKAFQLDFLEDKYPKTSGGKFNRLFWDQVWLDIDQSRLESASSYPIMPQGTLVNFAPAMGTDTINLGAFGSTLPSEKQDVSVNFNNFFFASTRYSWIEPDKGHYRITTNPNAEIWQEYWGIDYDNLPELLKNWEFGVYTSQAQVPSYVIEYKLPYFLITSLVPNKASTFSKQWPIQYSNISNRLADGNIIGNEQSDYAVITLTSIRAFRYQPGRISAFTYGVRVSEEGAGPGSLLEWGVENYTDGYFFRLQDGTDFSIIRRSTIPLGNTDLFTEAGYKEREAYLSQLTGVVKYKALLSSSEVLSLEEEVIRGNVTKIYETSIQQDQMNGDGLNGQGDSGYIFNPDTVTMYKIEFGWYGAIGARFYMYIPQGNGTSRWVTIHTLVIENQLGQPCLQDPFFFFKYRAYVGSPSRLRLPQFIEKYGASYYIDGGDEGTVSLSSGKAVNRKVPLIESDTVKVPTYKWSSVLGLRPKQYITNTEGYSLPNKKEIFPVSMSITSTKDAEIKFVNQYGCKENAYTFQEGYTCVLPEEQKLRGTFIINSLQTNASTLEGMGLNKTEFTPTLRYVGIDPNFPTTSENLRMTDEETGLSDFIGWSAYRKSLMGAHIIGDKVYCSYVNPEQEYVSDLAIKGFDSSEIVLSRSTEEPEYDGRAKNRAWSPAELLFRFKDPVPLKLSRYRKDTTLLSTIDITSNEFYLLFTRQGVETQGSYDGVCRIDGTELGCDGSHFGDMQIGVVWPKAIPMPNTYKYPDSIIYENRTGSDFGIINPKLVSDRNGLSADTKEVRIKQDLGTSDKYYVVDKTIPNSENYRYYEGLPVNFESLTENVLITNQVGWLRVGNSGLEIGEGLRQFTGIIDNQLPRIPGLDGGVCHAIYGKVGEIEEVATFAYKDVNGNLSFIPGESPITTYFLAKTSPWPEDLWKKRDDPAGLQTLLFLERSSDGVSTTVTTTGAEPQSYTPVDFGVELHLLQVTLNSGGTLFNDGEGIIAKYSAIALYAPSLTRPDERLIARRLTGSLFPIRFFVRMREGASIGSMTIGQVTPNGIIQTPFTPHGCTLSVKNIDNNPDIHDGGSSDTETSAKKSMIAYSHPGTLTYENYSYYDSSPEISEDKRKKCPSFISNSLLSGTGFSGVGDYPIRWLEFKESGDSVASFFVSANKPTEIDLSGIFNVNTESVGPSFWGNKALFMIARNLTTGEDGSISVTLNYKEQ